MKENGVLNEEELCDHANGIDDKLCNADHESVRRAAAFSWAQKKTNRSATTFNSYI